MRKNSIFTEFLGKSSTEWKFLDSVAENIVKLLMFQWVNHIFEKCMINISVINALIQK